MAIDSFKVEGRYIYINFAPKLGAMMHISLHASGNFSFKLGKEKRYPLEPPYILEKDQTGLIHGPCIFFQVYKRKRPPPKATGSTDKIIWLGWPEVGSLILVRTYYHEPGGKLLVDSNDILIGGPLEVKLFNKDMIFYMISENRPLTVDEPVTGYDYYKHIESGGKLPDSLDFIHVSKTNLESTEISAIVIHG